MFQGYRVECKVEELQWKELPHLCSPIGHTTSAISLGFLYTSSHIDAFVLRFVLDVHCSLSRGSRAKSPSAPAENW